MIDVVTEHLFDMNIQVPTEQAIDIGGTPRGARRIVKVVGGDFEGPKLKGTVIAGDDWLLVRSDGVMQLDYRIILETEDRHMTCMTCRGYRNVPQDVIDRMNSGEEVYPIRILLSGRAALRDRISQIPLAQ